MTTCNIREIKETRDVLYKLADMGLGNFSRADVNEGFTPMKI